MGMKRGEGSQISAIPFTLSPDADYNVLMQPSSLLVILLNVSVNTLPVLAFPVIHRLLRQLYPKVRQDWGPLAPSWDPFSPSWPSHTEPWRLFVLSWIQTPQEGT
jgi:hypothetical protein